MKTVFSISYICLVSLLMHLPLLMSSQDTLINLSEHYGIFYVPNYGEWLPGQMSNNDFFVFEHKNSGATVKIKKEQVSINNSQEFNQKILQYINGLGKNQEFVELRKQFVPIRVLSQKGTHFLKVKSRQGGASKFVLNPEVDKKLFHIEILENKSGNEPSDDVIRFVSLISLSPISAVDIASSKTKDKVQPQDQNKLQDEKDDLSSFKKVKTLPIDKKNEGLPVDKQKEITDTDKRVKETLNAFSAPSAESVFGGTGTDQPIDNNVVPMKLTSPEFFAASDSVSYTGDITLWAESMNLLLGEEQSNLEVSRRTAPYYLFPSPATREDVDKSLPFWIEALGLKSSIAASASAFDAAWEEAIVSAANESEEGTRTALELAFQHKKELDALQARFYELTKTAQVAGEPRDPIVELKKLRQAYSNHLKTLSEFVGVKTSPDATGSGWGYKLIKQEFESGGSNLFFVPGEYPTKGTEASFHVSFKNQGLHEYNINWKVPQVIFPQTPTEFWIKGNVSSKTMNYASIQSGGYIIAGIRVWGTLTDHHLPNYPEDRFSVVFPDLNKMTDELKKNGKSRYVFNLRDQVLMSHQVTESEGGWNDDPGVPSDNHIVEVVEEVRRLEDLPNNIVVDVVGWDSRSLIARYTYEWSNNINTTLASSEPTDDPSDPEKRQRIAEIDANIAIIRNNIRKDRQDMGKETDASRRAQFEFRILQGESDVMAEEDLKQSILTGQNVHTRSPFDDHARGLFIESIRQDQMRMEEFHRCSSSLQRLAALLPPGDAELARKFIERQVTPADYARLDANKLRKIGGLLFKQVQAKAQEYAARGEEEAAQVGLDYAMKFKAAADGGMMATSMVAGPWLNVAYQGATGTLEGGFTEGLTRAASTYSMPTFLAAQAYQGYQAGGWKQAGENIAISFITGKAIQYGLSKSITTVGKIFNPSSQEPFNAARFKQSREQGVALVKDLQRTEGDVIRFRAAVSRGESDAGEKLKQALLARETKATIVHENMHAKNFLKYNGDYHTQKIFNEDLAAIHQKTQKIFHETMQQKGWSKTPLKEFRNASSAGSSGMDYDIGIDEAATLLLTKGGQKATLYNWQKEAQGSWNEAYKVVTGRSAQRSWETVTTRVHPEAYKDLAWLSGNPTSASKLWAQQAADVTRFKNWHISNDPNLQVYEKLQEISRGTAKDMQTKLIPLLNKATSKGGTSTQAMQNTSQHWRKIFGVLEKFGKGDTDPITASRKIRELTGGKSINEVTQDMATLMEGLSK